MNILSHSDVDRDTLEKLFNRANGMKQWGVSHPLTNQVLGSIFLEPSTRTRLSFETGMLRLNGKVVSIPDGAGSSEVKGESLYDTLMTIGQYVDVMVIRTPEELPDLTDFPCPVINAGDGSREHPTQAMLDIYTIWKHFGKVEGLKVAVAGDIMKSRSIHSFCRMLEICYDIWPIQYDSVTGNYDEWRIFQNMLPSFDVLYTNRVQRERHDNGDTIRDTFGLTRHCLPKLKEDMIVLNPGPRQGELPAELDADPRIKFFEQANNGLWVRMAILQYVLGRASN